jgi:hypothetical protein
MRVVLFVLIVAVIAVIAGVASGFLNISQTREARAPEVSTTSNGVSAKGGQTPAFDVQTGSVKVGSKEANVKVPAVILEKPGQKQAAAATTNNAQ